jgi:hypothetical protein
MYDDQMTRFRFSVLPDFLTGSGTGKGSTQPHDDNVELHE